MPNYARTSLLLAVCGIFNAVTGCSDGLPAREAAIASSDAELRTGAARAENAQSLPLLMRGNDSGDSQAPDRDVIEDQSAENRIRARLVAQAGQPPAYGEEKEKIDPVEANGAIFENWPKPRASIVFSGLQEGYIEPCGCAGLENQKGGLARKHTLIKQLAADGWNPLPLDLGQLVKRYGRQQEIKYERIVEAMKTMGYKAIGFGPDDLRLPGETVFAITAPVEDQETPFVSANVTVFDESIIPRFKVLQVGGLKIGVTSVLGKEYQKLVKTEGIEFADPVAALGPVVKQLTAAKCDLLILLSHSTKKESVELAKAFPQFHFVATAGGAEEPPRQPEVVPGTRVRMIEVGHKGMYAAVLGIYDDRQNPVRYQRVPLDHRFEDAREMQEVMATYQDQLKFEYDQLVARPAPHPSGRTFVGSEKCSECHTNAHEKWSSTPHSHATETLLKLEVPRSHDPECLSCHVTGWEPQKYIPFESGFLDLKDTAHLTTNGCENCHGPGSAHVAAQSGEIDADDAMLKKLQQEMRVAKHADTCLKCHDLDNSPDFHKDNGFEKYWKEVEHYGKD